MLTRRQKNSLRGFTAALSGCALLAAFLIFTNISNASEAEPVVFSDILEGAVAYGDDSELPAETLPEHELTETMFAEELATFTLRLSPEYTYPEVFSDNDLSPEDITIDLDDIGDTTVTTTVSEAPTATFSHAYQGTIKGTGTKATFSEIVTEPESSFSSSNTLLINETVSAVTSETIPAETTASATTTMITAPVTTPAATTSQITTTAATTVTTRSTTTTTRITTTATTKATTRTTTTPVTTTSAATTTTAPVSTTTDKTAFTNIGGGVFSNDASVYLTMFELVNKARREAGLEELWYSARLHEVCQLRTTELTSYYSHTRPNGTKFSTAYKELGVQYKICGENIAYGRNMFSTVEEVFTAWMNSPSHRENILSPEYKCVAFGLSTLKIGNDTYYYWSQEFATLE